MHRRTPAQYARHLAVVVVAVVGAACDGTETVQSVDESFAASSHVDEIQAVRQVTARYHSVTQATKDGYVDTEECVAAPGIGAMGVHWLNESLVDPVFDPLQPETVLYEPDANGKLKLVAVEYIVIDVGQERPSFAGHPFDIGGTPVPVDHWSLHVWLYKDNPSGTFAAFNPTVSCP
jgi:hypothetical protein